MASARPRYHGEPVKRLLDRVRCVIGVEGFIRYVYLRTNTADPAGIGIDYSAANLDAGLETELASRLLAEVPNHLAGGGPETVLQQARQLQTHRQQNR